MSPIRVLIVDDSPTMRTIIGQVLRRDPGIEVVGTAADPYEAREAIKRLSPDVVTLDIEMPRMNGIEFLEKIMRLRPMPVVMVSSLTQKGAEHALEALSIGAFDCIGKPANGDVASAFARLPDIVKAAATTNTLNLASRSTTPPAQSKVLSSQQSGLSLAERGFMANRIIAIGSSTGGVDALAKVLSRFPANCPATVITQHMPLGYTASFAARLDRTCAPTVREAVNGAPLRPGHVYLAPGGECHLEISGGDGRSCVLRSGEPVSGHRPSVDVMFDSVSRFGNRVVGVILTGMGRDGAAGLKKIREAGGRTLGQDEATCVVYGMPGAAAACGAVEREVPLQKMGDAIMALCSQASEAAA